MGIICLSELVQHASGEVSLPFGHANANFSVFIACIRNQFLKNK